jgi:UDP-N-acetylmuramate--alanine ligase
LILPIYLPSGREVAARPVTSADVVAAIQLMGPSDARAVASFDEAEEVVVAGAQPGDVVLTMGAGDVTLLSDRLLAALGDRR